MEKSSGNSGEAEGIINKRDCRHTVTSRFGAWYCRRLTGHTGAILLNQDIESSEEV